MDFPLFIVIEGIDGSGKDTQAEMLRDYLRSKNHDCVISSEPTTSAIGRLIRAQMGEEPPLSFESDDAFDACMAYLFAADRHGHIHDSENGVLALLKEKTTVISTRYVISSFAYNAKTPPLQSLVKQLNKDFPNPDLLIYLDLPVDEAIKRLKARTRRECYEVEETLIQVKQRYQNYLEGYESGCWTVDAAGPLLSVHRQIVEKIESLSLGGGDV